MTTPQRYDSIYYYNQDRSSQMREVEDGDYVTYEDYASLLALYKESEEKRKETAKDFEAAFRLVRQENDQLRKAWIGIQSEKEL